MKKPRVFIAFVFIMSNFIFGISSKENLAQRTTYDVVTCQNAVLLMPSNGQLGWTYQDPDGGVAGYSNVHTGIDILGTSNDDIYAVYGGVVTKRSDPIVWIWHPELGFETFYSHLSAIFVNAGQAVTRGEIIGKKGKVGTEIVHLHFSIKKKGTDERVLANTFDPSLYLDANVNYVNGARSFQRLVSEWCYSYPILGDINRDSKVDILDYVMLFQDYGKSGVVGFSPADINHDGKVNILDYTYLFENFGKSKLTSTTFNELGSTPLSIPLPPSHISFSQDTTDLGNVVIVHLSWDDEADDEDGFRFIWDLEDYGGSTITATDIEPPPPPSNVKLSLSASNYTNSALAMLPCGKTSTTRNITASVNAFNLLGVSNTVSGIGTVVIPACPIPGDGNSDGKVDGIDYVIWLQHYNQTTVKGSQEGDFNRDGKVDGIDYVIWLTNYGINLSNMAASNNTDITASSIPYPPTNVSLTYEKNSTNTAATVSLNWKDNANDEDGFIVTWDGINGNTIFTLPNPPRQSDNTSRTNTTSTVIAVIPCDTTSGSTIHASIRAFNTHGASEAVFATKAICPWSIYLPLV